MNLQSIPVPAYSPQPHTLVEALKLNEPNLDIRGGTVRVEALLDFEGLSQLEEHLKALKMLLKPRKALVALADDDTKESDEPNSVALLGW